VGHHTNSIIFAGEPIRFARIDEVPSVLENVPVGTVAVTIPTDPVRAIGGQVRVGMQVDLLCPAATGGMDVLARDVIVLALSTDDTGADDVSTSGILGGRNSLDIRWITLCVESELAQQVVSAATAGKVYLTYSGQSLEK
jgi:Flp pilus assembly protein CpaB